MMEKKEIGNINISRHASREELEKAARYSFDKWRKAYEMLAAGEEPEKDDVSENELEN